MSLSAAAWRPMLYEAVGLAAIAWLLIRWRRKGISDIVVFARYLVLAGTLRFAIEFVRVNAPILGSLTLAQLLSGAMIVAGFSVFGWAVEKGSD